MKKKTSIPIETLEEIYGECKIRIIEFTKELKNLNLKAKPNENELAVLLRISHLVNSIKSALQFEPQNIYKEAILDISIWLDKALQADYLCLLEEGKGNYKRFYDSLVKGSQALDVLIHRNFKRIEFTQREKKHYDRFWVLAASLPDPRGETLDQTKVDKLIDDLLG
ncbi:MAG: hypothetical protein K2X39_07075 [Silvanigrellaceae bacterium]|nr:hypothetical protein [Silvanigrellaceae bacterium]